ncbi:MAG: hypothetical protein KDH96_12390, partial [Candidatus Riesia sp.]|nr:hypothetical protein [Candidatus Riesia sp.]
CIKNVKFIIYEQHIIYVKEVKNKIVSLKINKKLSGDCLITGINYIYEPNRGGFSQELTMVKRELTLEYNKERLDELTKKFYPSKIK